MTAPSDRIHRTRNAARAFLDTPFSRTISTWLVMIGAVRQPAEWPSGSITFRDHLRRTESDMRATAEGEGVRAERMTEQEDPSAADWALRANDSFLRHRNLKLVLHSLETLASAEELSPSDWERHRKNVRQTASVLKQLCRQWKPSEGNPVTPWYYRAFKAMHTRWGEIESEMGGPPRA